MILSDFHKIIAILLLALCLGIFAFYAIGVGTFSIPHETMTAMLFGHIDDVSNTAQFIIFDTRIPRIIASIVWVARWR